MNVINSENKIKYSLIVPVYNVCNYIEDCIKSILNQTYSEWELILVNDGSTDNSAAICECYSKTDSRIIYFSQENKGVSAARNLGLFNANGDYIMFCDGDDMLEPYALETINTYGSQYDIVNFCLTTYHRNGKKIAKKKFPPSGEYEFKDKAELFKTLLANDFLGSACTKAINSKFLNGSKAKIRFEEEINYAEDQVFCNELFFLTQKSIFIDKHLYVYRIRKSSAINGFNIKRIKDGQKLIEYLYCFAEKCNLEKTKLQALITLRLVKTISVELAILFKIRISNKEKRTIFNQVAIIVCKKLKDCDVSVPYYNILRKALLAKKYKRVKTLIFLREFIAKLFGKRRYSNWKFA